MISSITPTSPAQGSHDEKLVRAAHQFEAVLLNQLLGSLEHSFSNLGKHKAEDGSDQYQFLGMQTLATSIAEHGGVGIAEMIIRNLRRQDHSAGNAKQ